MLVHPACNRLPALPHASHQEAPVPTAHKLVPGASQVGGDQVCVYLVPEHLMGDFLIRFRPESHSLQASVSQQTCNPEGLEKKKVCVFSVVLYAATNAIMLVSFCQRASPPPLVSGWCSDSQELTRSLCRAGEPRQSAAQHPIRLAV